MLGHASAAMTLDVYADLFDDDLDSVATVLDQKAQPRVWAKCGQTPDSRFGFIARIAKSPGIPGLSMVAPTGVDPVTFRFSVERSTN